MTRSANEVMVLAGKAARGAGAPPAQAAQFGAAVVTHLTANRDIAELERALAALPNGPIISLPLAILRLVEGQEGGIARGLLEGEGALIESYLANLPCMTTLDADGTTIIDLNTLASRVRPPRIDLPAEVYTRWSALAARLLVPESDASRLSGAGAGLTDND